MMLDLPRTEAGPTTLAPVADSPPAAGSACAARPEVPAWPRGVGLRAARGLTVSLTLLLFACTDASQTEIARGNVLASRGRPEEAAVAYAAAAKAAPRRARPRELLGHLLYDLGKADQAKAAYQEALTVEPAAAIEARIGLARIAADAGRLDEAIGELSALLSERQDNLYALLSRAHLAIRRGGPADAEQAIQDTAAAMRIDAKGAPVLYTRGLAFLAAGSLPQAEEAFALLRQRHSDSPLADYGLARLAAARGDRPAAIAHLKAARGRTAPSLWRPKEIAADRAFSSLHGDPAFTDALGMN